MRPRVSWKTDRTSFSKRSSRESESTEPSAASITISISLGVASRLAPRERKIKPSLQVRLEDDLLRFEAFTCDLGYVGMLALTESKAAFLSQNGSGQNARRQKKSGRSAARRTGPHRAKGPSIRGFLADQCGARGYLGPGVPPKKRGCPTTRKTNREYSNTDSSSGCQEILTSPSLLRLKSYAAGPPGAARHNVRSNTVAGPALHLPSRGR